MSNARVVQPNHVKEIIQNELLTLLNESGYSRLVEVILDNEAKVFTKKGARLKKSTTARLMGITLKQLDEALKKCRILLGEDEKD